MRIPTDKYARDLLLWVWQQRIAATQTESADSALLPILESIARIDFDRPNHPVGAESIVTKRFLKEELDFANKYHLCESENLYVRAVCLDLACKEEKDKRDKALKASDAYLELFEKSDFHEPWYLLRSLEVRKIKCFYTDAYLERICQLSVHVYPAWLEREAELLTRSYALEKLKPFISLLEDRLLHVDDEGHREGERQILKALLTLKQRSLTEWYRANALSYEKELDYTNEHAKPNTFYAHLADTAQKAYQAIHCVKKVFPADEERIQQKLVDEQLKYIQLFPLFGTKFSYGFTPDELEQMEKCIAKMEITDAVSLIKQLKNLPFPPSEVYSSAVNDLKENSFTAQHMGSVSVGGDGRILGTSNPEEATRIYVHKHLRARYLQTIALFFDCMAKQNEQVDEELLYHFFCTVSRATYVEEQRLPLWVMGLMAGCKGDMITASHLLIPQIEHALKVKMASCGGKVLKLEDETHQDEYNLMAVLAFLKPYFKENLYDEFYFFFTCGNDENFRNRLSHGISSIDELKRSGLYTWWIAIKMFFCETELFLEVKE